MPRTERLHRYWRLPAIRRAVLATTAISVSSSGCKLKLGKDAEHMDERGPAIWVVDGRNVQIDRTYFQRQPKDVAFIVEWRCPECRPEKMIGQQALAAARPVLWHAIESGEANRTAFNEIGGGRPQTTRLVGVITHEVEGTPKQTTVSIDNIEAPLDWTWVLGGQSYRVFGPGYYFDVDARRLYFTIKWHHRDLCPKLIGITDDQAANLAMPIMKHVHSRKIYRAVAQVGDSATVTAVGGREVGAIGVEIGCPDPSCAGAVTCPARGYRVSRTLAEIAAASTSPPQ